MRHARMIAALVAVLAMAAPAFAQSISGEMTIAQPDVEVRSGPSKVFFATSKLKQGDKVIVLRESKDAPGWLEIRPPSPQSFSWISAKNVAQVDATHASVSVASAPLLPGSRVVEESGNPLIDNTAGIPGLTGTAVRAAAETITRTAGAVSAARTFLDDLRGQRRTPS